MKLVLSECSLHTECANLSAAVKVVGDT